MQKFCTLSVLRFDFLVDLPHYQIENPLNQLHHYNENYHCKYNGHCVVTHVAVLVGKVAQASSAYRSCHGAVPDEVDYREAQSTQQRRQTFRYHYAKHRAPGVVPHGLRRFHHACVHFL